MNAFANKNDKIRKCILFVGLIKKTAVNAGGFCEITNLFK